MNSMTGLEKDGGTVTSILIEMAKRDGLPDFDPAGGEFNQYSSLHLTLADRFQSMCSKTWWMRQAA